ncbi:Thioredoxin-related transmembrane protein 1 [Echinococcus granulosus]|uniref:Thioredoxin fold n=1 Tax=Echinococcus granulosus TaxID=6210 RepID=U6IYI5_ECHGR|nr:Thioredoxin-related transmembrane protein [Echinococcus granulosus]EUB63468.1 Thioredoxin-related transmembrane protein [Echinococcus granulosus]KAH9285879.1 Thioredoxin-related transmembrane protein 1 [Echinococcus granulosus]CDS16103.1 Thioredoxin fold [Echinococcus granulosus]
MLCPLCLCVFFLPFCTDAQESLPINVSNWTTILSGEWMVEFYAPWCPACNLVAVEWKRFAELAPHHDIKVAQLDCSAESAVAMIFTITSLPTIFHVKDGVFRNVKGKRKTDQLLHFIENREFELIEPTTWSLSPNAFYMSAVVRFLDLCLSITKAHRAMTDYGVPASLSIILVGTGVLASGAAMGMLILCVCEYFCPPRPQILNIVGMEGEPPKPIVTKENDMEQDSVLEDSEDNSWTEVKPLDTKDCVQADEPLVLRRCNSRK